MDANENAIDQNPDGNNETEPVEDDEQVELSLDELGRAYAKAVGLVADHPDEEATTDVAESELDDETVCPISPLSILEAILFVGTPDDDQFLTSRKIASWMRDVSAKEVNQLVKELNDQYESEGAAYRIQKEKEKLRLVLSEEFESIRERFYGEVRKARLSQQAIDVLAIVAYNQPASHTVVEKMRGRNCNAILNQLVKRQLLSTEKNETTKTREYRTTDRFLELFNLASIDDLPQSEDALLPDADV